jgi:hypothetical protein
MEWLNLEGFGDKNVYIHMQGPYVRQKFTLELRAQVKLQAHYVHTYVRHISRTSCRVLSELQVLVGLT